MADITMFELHFHDDIGLGRSAAGGAGADDDARSSGDTDADEEASSGSGLGRIVVALAAIALFVLLGVGAKKLLSDDLEPIEELEGLDEEEGTAPRGTDSLRDGQSSSRGYAGRSSRTPTRSAA